MLNFVFGTFSTGKTYYTDTEILKSLKDGKDTVLLVPEQEVMEAERRIADRADIEGVFCEKLTVVSFRRLANLAFRKYGGIEYKYLDEGGRLLAVWKITEELAPSFSAYRNNRDKSFVSMMLSVIDELRRYSVPPFALANAAENITDPEMKAKLSDISLTYTAYLATMKEDFADSENDLDRLSEIMRTEDFLSGYRVFADSFNGFTYPELNILGHIMRRCDLTVTLCRPEKDGLTGFRTVEETEKDLLSIANKYKIKVSEPIRLSEDGKYLPPDISLISSSLFGTRKTADLDRKSDRIVLCRCKDVFSEAEFVACNICELIRNGQRYRDIAIVTRNTADFDGVFDVVLEKYGIPLFFSKRTSLTSTGIFRTVQGAIDIISGGWQTEDVITYAKSGIVGLSVSETDMLERYALEWNISGKRWTDEYEWNMNPNGYTDEKRPDHAEYLEKVNYLRRKLCSPVEKLRNSVSGNVTVTEYCRALYAFIGDSGIYDHYREYGAKEDVTVYNKFTETLDTMVSVTGEIEVNTQVFSALFNMCASNTDFGRIPETGDQVVLGDASILRITGRKYIFLTSCEEGNFPKSVTDDSFITDSEKNILKENGISLSPDTVQRNDAELFYFIRCACGAKNKLFATYKMQDGKYYPSSGFSALCSLFPGNKIISFPEGVADDFRIQTLHSSREAALSVTGTPVFSAVSDIYREKGIDFLSSKPRLFDEKATVSERNLNKLFGRSVNLSSYSAEAFAKCPFSYYGKHILKLSERKKSTFGATDMGNYIHRILELIVLKLYPSDGVSRSYTEKELEIITSDITDEVLSGIFGKDTVMSGRLSALFTRMKRTLLMLVKNIVSEFDQSLFRPRFFETEIGKKEGSIDPVTVTLPDGRELFIFGRIDRIDTYEKNGNVYVRIVDYKSGSRTHSLDNIKYGLDMQMLLYLFAIWKTTDRAVLSRFGVGDGGNIIPAGVLYQQTRLSTESVKTPADDEDISSKTEKMLQRKGLLLDNTEILDAMEKGLSGRFLHVKTKDGKLCASEGELCSLEGFGQLLSEVSVKLTEIGNEILSGKADVHPKELPSELDPCKFCELKFVCRKPEKI